MKKIIFLIAAISVASFISFSRPDSNTFPGETKPTDDPTFVNGAQFMDRFLPLTPGKMSSDVWGAKNVIPRNVENGIESDKYSYWGGNIMLGDDGKYHLFVCRWPENISRSNGKSGHELWWDSDVVHAVSDYPDRGYKVIQEIGKGHNPEIFRLKDKSYVIGVMGNKAYKAPTINGPWTQFVAPPLKALGAETRRDENCTYIVEDDGSVFMVNKEGYTFRGDGSTETYYQIPTPKAYHRYNGSHEEDPVIWKDSVCYNLMINDCLGRKAYHLTSKDGNKWSYEEGLAYTVGLIVNQNGVKEDWDKLERSKVLQDKYGRVTHINFAAVDTLKGEDRANDNHSSKNIVVPLRISRLMRVVSPKKIDSKVSEIVVFIEKEENFNPSKEIDLKTLRLGSAKFVNHGNGLTAVKMKKSKGGVVITFKGDKSGITSDDYKIKLLGGLKNGEPIWSQVRID